MAFNILPYFICYFKYVGRFVNKFNIMKQVLLPLKSVKTYETMHSMSAEIFEMQFLSLAVPTLVCLCVYLMYLHSIVVHIYVLILTRPDRKNRRVRPSGICQRSASSFSFKEGKNVICINCRQHTNAVHMPSTCSPHTLSLVYSTHCSCYSPHLNSGSRRPHLYPSTVAFILFCI